MAANSSRSYHSVELAKAQRREALKGKAMRDRDVPIYLDFQATTPLDGRVLDAMLPFFKAHFGNPHSVHHAYGTRAKDAVEAARGQVAALIGASPPEIVFTSGATEANNLALRGAARQLCEGGRPHVVITTIEHKCVLEVARQLQRDGHPVTQVPVRPDGLVDPAALKAVLRPETGLVSVMAVNNEIGVAQPIGEIGALCRSRGILFHTDAAQAAGKLPIDVRRMNIDLLSLSAHKLYGPKGVGALFIRGRPRLRLDPLILGGGQEAGMRSGTAPTPLCVGFGAACDLAGAEMEREAVRLGSLRDRFLFGLRDADIRFTLNGHASRRVPGNLNLSFEGVDAEALLMRLRETVALSSGSACAAGGLEPSHVLAALGLPLDRAEAAVRIGFGRTTTAEEVEQAAKRIAGAVHTLSRLSRPAPVQAHG